MEILPRAPMLERENSPTAARKAWTWVAVALLLLVILLGAGAGGYLRYANQVPPYTPPTVTMPNPNAYADFVAAGRLLPRNKARLAEGQSLTPAELKKAVGENRIALARLRQGFGREYLNPPLLSFKQLLPEIADFRHLGRALVREGELAEHEGRLQDAARSYVDCLRLGSRVPRGGGLIHGLVGLAIQEMALRALQRVADRLDGPTAAAVAREMEALDREAVPLQAALAHEKIFGLAGIHELLRERNPAEASASLSGQVDSQGNPVTSNPAHRIAFTLTPKRQMVEGYSRYMDALISRAGKPFGQRGAPPPLPADPLGKMLVPAVDQAQERWDWRDTQWRLAELRLAAIAYHREYGHPAARTTQLVPRYLQAVPVDPFSSQPLIYRLRDGKPLVYSRGPDGDDDRGKHFGSQRRAEAYGDVVWVGPLQGGNR